MTYEVTMTAIYLIEADNEEAAEYAAIDRLKEELPANDADLNIAVAESTQVDANSTQVEIDWANFPVEQGN